MRASLGPEGRQLRCKAPVGVERERRALEDEFVLAADFVEIDDWQAAFDDARNRDVLRTASLSRS